MKRLWLFIPLAILLAILGIIFVIYNTLDYEKDSPMVGQQIPSLILQGIEGGEMDLADLTGQVYLLHVGASWCESSKMEIPQLKELTQQGLPVVGVFYKDSVENAQALLQSDQSPYQLAFLDSDGGSLVHLGGVALPTSYLIDEEGVIQAVFSGPIYSSKQVTELIP